MPENTDDRGTETVKQSIGFTAIGSVGSQVITLLGFIFLARLLSPYEFGLISMIAIFMAISMVLVSSGMGSALIHNQHMTDRHCSTTFWFNVIVGLVLCLILTLLAEHISVFFGEDKLKNVVMVCAWLLPLNALLIVPFSLLQKSSRFKILTQIELVSVSSGVVLALVLAWLGYSYWALVANMYCAALVKLLLSFIAVKVPVICGIGQKEFSELWGYSRYLLASSLFHDLVENFDKLIVGKYLNSATLGAYSSASRMANLPSSLIVQVLNKVFFPVYANIQDDVAQIKKMHLKTIRIVAFFSIPLMLSISVLSENIVLTLLGEKWVDMVYMLEMLGFIFLIRTLASMNGPIFLSQGANRLNFYLTVGMRSNVLLATILGIQFGLAGLLWALLLARLINFIPALYFAGKLIDVSLADYFYSLWRTFLCAGFLYVLVDQIKTYIPMQSDSFLLLLLLAIVTIIVYLAVSWLLNGRILKEVFASVVSNEKMGVT